MNNRVQQRFDRSIREAGETVDRIKAQNQQEAVDLAVAEAERILPKAYAAYHKSTGEQRKEIASLIRRKRKVLGIKVTEPIPMV